MRLVSPKANGAVIRREEDRFPVIERLSNHGQRRIIRVFGFTHGYNGDFQKYSVENKAAISRAINRFGREDYLLVEGYETDLAKRAFEKKTGGAESFPEDLKDHMEKNLISLYDRLRFCERFEWYAIFASTEEELRLRDIGRSSLTFTDGIRMAYSQDEAQQKIRELFDCFEFSKELIIAIKEHEIKNLIRLSGLPEETVRIYIEKSSTFRSLLAARTALWRSELMDVNLFMGILHAAEIVEFLTNQNQVDQYVSCLPERLKYVYSLNEFYQGEITRIFKQKQLEAIRENLLPIFLRWLAYKVYEAEYGLNPAMTLDYSEYRAVVIGVMKKTGRNDPCICFSGEKFKKCCGPSLDLFLKVESLS